MALRNYLYAKHAGDAYTAALINKTPSDSTTNDESLRRPIPRRVHIHKRKQAVARAPHSHPHHHSHDNEYTTQSPPTREEACGSGREIVLEDGAKKCANCADCPKKLTHGSELAVSAPKEEVVVSEDDINVSASHSESSLEEVEASVKQLYLGKEPPREVDFTNVL